MSLTGLPEASFTSNPRKAVRPSQEKVDVACHCCRISSALSGCRTRPISSRGRRVTRCIPAFAGWDQTAVAAGGNLGNCLIYWCRGRVVGGRVSDGAGAGSAHWVKTAPSPIRFRATRNETRRARSTNDLRQKLRVCRTNRTNPWAHFVMS